MKVRGQVILAVSSEVPYSPTLTRHTDDTSAPYEVTSLNASGDKKSVNLAQMADRLVGPTGCTEEELSLVNSTFEVYTPADPNDNLMEMNSRKRKLRVKTKHHAGETFCVGGITTVKYDPADDSTTCEAIYHDGEKESIPIQDILTNTVLRADPDRLARRRALKALHDKHAPPKGTKRRLVARHANSKTGGTTKGTPIGCATRRPNKQGQKYFDWTAPGLFFSRRYPLPREDGRHGDAVGSSGGPGIPGGTRSGVG